MRHNQVLHAPRGFVFRTRLADVGDSIVRWSDVVVVLTVISMPIEDLLFTIEACRLFNVVRLSNGYEYRVAQSTRAFIPINPPTGDVSMALACLEYQNGRK